MPGSSYFGRLNIVPLSHQPTKYIHVPIPGTCGCYLLWWKIKGGYDGSIDWLQMWLHEASWDGKINYPGRWDLQAITGVLTEKSQRDISQILTQEKLWRCWPRRLEQFQGKRRNSGSHQKLGRAGSRFSSSTSRGSVALRTPCFQTSGL